MAVIYLKTIALIIIMRSSQLKMRRLSAKNNSKEREKTTSWFPQSKETEARQSLIGMQFEDTIQANMDWANDPKLTTSHWLTNFDPQTLNRGFSPNTPIKTKKIDDYLKKSLRKTSELQVNPEVINLMKGVRPMTGSNLSYTPLPLKKSVFGCLMQQILVSRQHEYDISPEYQQHTKTTKPFRPKPQNLLKFSKSTKFEVEDRRSIPGQDRLNMVLPESQAVINQSEPLYFSTRYNQFPIRHRVTRRIFSPTKTASKLQVEESLLDPLNIDFGKFKKIQSERKPRLSTYCNSPLRMKKKCSEVAVQGHKIF